MTQHQHIIREMVRAQLLPGPQQEGLTADERRKVRNQLKALRKKHRR